MASNHRFDKTLTLAERRAVKFMAQRLRDAELRHQAFLATLDPRQREALSYVRARD